MGRVEACLCEAKSVSARGQDSPATPWAELPVVPWDGGRGMGEARAGENTTVCFPGRFCCRALGLLCLLKNLPRKIHVSLILAGVFEGEGAGGGACCHFLPDGLFCPGKNVCVGLSLPHSQPLMMNNASQLRAACFKQNNNKKILPKPNTAPGAALEQGTELHASPGFRGWKTKPPVNEET